MKRLSLLLLGGLAMVAVAACPGKKPETTAAPAVPNNDSIEAERRKADSIAQAERDARAREQAERQRQQQIADSLAAIGKTTDAVKTMLATMIHFDYDK